MGTQHIGDRSSFVTTLTDQLLDTGKGKLSRIVVCKTPGTGGTLTLRDGTTVAGSIIGTLTFTTTEEVRSIELDVHYETGLFLDFTTIAGAEFLFVYRK